MRTTMLTSLLAIVLIGAIASCGTQNIGNDVAPAKDAAGFKLNVLSDSFIDGASAAGFGLKVEDFGQDVMVSVNATGAQGLKALYFELEYNADKFRPLTASPTKEMGRLADIVTLHSFQERGTVVHGQVLANYPWRSGVVGDATLATMVFRKEATPIMRGVSATFTSAQSGATVAWNGVDTLTWEYSNQGDYDQNGEANISDLTPVAAHLGETAPFAADGTRRVDGDGNGEINVSDLTGLAANLGRVFASYEVFSGAVPGDYPAGGTSAGTVDFTGSTGTPPAAVRVFTFVVAGAPAEYYWVKPTDGTVDGRESNLVATNPANAPVLTLTNPPGAGSGSVGDPYVVDNTTDYVFQLEFPAGTDVTNDAATTWPPMQNDQSADGDSTFNWDDAVASGTVQIQATHNSVGSNVIFLSFNSAPPAGLFIHQDSSDATWASVTGAGTDVDPWVCAVGGGFNATFTEDFLLRATPDAPGTGTDLNEADYTWAANPPFIATFGTPGLFQANTFTNGYVFATETADPTNESDHKYVVSQALPN